MNKNHAIRSKVYGDIMHLIFVHRFQGNLFVSAHNLVIYVGI